MSPEESAAIDRWVAETMARPWPLSSTQLAVIRDALGGVEPETPSESDRVA